MVIADAPLHPRLNTIATAKATFEMTTMEIDQLFARELKHALQQGDTRRVRDIGVSADRHRCYRCESPLTPQHWPVQFGALAINFAPIPAIVHRIW